MNFCFYTGRVGKPPKYARSESGVEYVSFSIEETSQEAYRGNYAILHFSCFSKKVLDYLKRVEFKQGNIVVVVARTDYFPEEVKGKTIYRMGLNATKVLVVKT